MSDAPAAPRFAADAMLARLARWLRTLGWDTSFDPELHERELVRRADAGHRILLTRDRRLLRDLQPRHALEIRHDAPLQQLHQVVHQLALPAPQALFTRCTVCNTVLSPPLDDADRRHLLPPDVRELPGLPACGLARLACTAHAAGDRAHLARLAAAAGDVRQRRHPLHLVTHGNG